MPDRPIEEEVVRWVGRGGEDACHRYANAHLGVTVVAWRYPKTQLVIGMQKTIG